MTNTVSLPYFVQKLLEEICVNKLFSMPDTPALKRLANIDEDSAIDVLNRIRMSSVKIYNLSGYIVHMVKTYASAGGGSVSGSNSYNGQEVQSVRFSHCVSPSSPSSSVSSSTPNTKLLALRRQLHLSPWTDTETTLQGKSLTRLERIPRLHPASVTTPSDESGDIRGSNLDQRERSCSTSDIGIIGPEQWDSLDRRERCPVVSFPTQDDKAVTELRQLRNASCGLFQGMGYGLGELMRLLALGKPCVSNCLAVCYVVKPFRTTTSDAETTSDGQLNDNEWLLYRLVPSHVVLPSLGTLVVFGLVRPTRWLRSKVTRGNNEWLLRKPILRSSVIVVMALWNTADRHLLQATVGHKWEKSYAIIGASNLFGDSKCSMR
ncbi:hypothetical protein Tco_0692180 [Tanacetum coccineum]